MCEETSERAMTGRDLANTIFVYFSELSVVLLYDYYFFVVLFVAEWRMQKRWNY
jgi:hypothetical protein